MREDEVYYVSEHRGAYNNTEELPDINYDEPDVVLFPISITRFAAMEAARELKKEGIKVAVHHIVQIKPFLPTVPSLKQLTNSKFGGIVLDDDYVDGIAKSLSFDLMKQTNAKMSVLGLEDKTAGFYAKVDNLPPNKEKIIAEIRRMMK